MPIILILAVAIAIVAVFFALQNAMVVTVSFLFFQFDSTLALILLVTLGLGIIIGSLGLLPNLFKKRLEISRQKKRILQLESHQDSKPSDIELTQPTDPPNPENTDIIK